jgi:hypothetical protein
VLADKVTMAIDAFRYVSGIMLHECTHLVIVIRVVCPGMRYSGKCQMTRMKLMILVHRIYYSECAIVWTLTVDLFSQQL